MRRTLVNLFVAVTSLAVLVGSWVGVARADESRRAREAAEQDSTALAESIRSAGADTADEGPAGAAPTQSAAATPPVVTSTPTATAAATKAATTAPNSTAVAGASATPPRVTATSVATPPAPGLIPAPTATVTPTIVPTPLATPSATPVATATPRKIIRPSRAS